MADIVAAGDLAECLAVLVAAANRLALLAFGQLRFAAQLDATQDQSDRYPAPGPNHTSALGAETRRCALIKEVGFARDSPLEEDGFELVVPLSKRTAAPSSPFGFPADGTGCERSNLRKRRFRVPGSQGNLARQGTCVVLNGWCIEACVGGVTGWAIGAGGDPRKPIRDCPGDGGARESPRPSDVRPSHVEGQGGRGGPE